MRKALHIGLAIMQLLETLHTAGFVHGDVHVGNIVTKKLGKTMGELGLPDLALINFEYARFFPAEIGTDPLSTDSEEREDNTFLSP